MPQADRRVCLQRKQTWDAVLLFVAMNSNSFPPGVACKQAHVCCALYVGSVVQRTTIGALRQNQFQRAIFRI